MPQPTNLDFLTLQDHWHPHPGPPVVDAGMSTTDVLTLVIAGLSLLGAIIGTWLAFQRAKASDNTAKEALRDAQNARREATEQSLWTGAIEAIGRLTGFDPAAEPVGTRNQDLRIRLTLLVDQFHTWEDLDTWLAEELALGAALGREVMAKATRQDTIDQRLAIIEDYATWAVVLSKNLRYFRRTGYDPDLVRRLLEHARQTRTELYASNNWGPIPAQIQGIELLDTE